MTLDELLYFSEWGAYGAPRLEWDHVGRVFWCTRRQVILPKLLQTLLPGLCMELSSVSSAHTSKDKVAVWSCEPSTPKRVRKLASDLSYDLGQLIYTSGPHCLRLENGGMERMASEVSPSLDTPAGPSMQVRPTEGMGCRTTECGGLASEEAIHSSLTLQLGGETIILPGS